MTITTITGIAAAVLGSLYAFQAFVMPKAPLGEPTAPMIFPAILGAAMVLLGLLLLVQEKIRLSKIPGREEKKASFKLTGYGKSIAIVAALCIVYVFLFERIGYVFSTFLFLAAVLHYFNGRTKWKTTLTVSVSFSVGIYAVFSVLLGISLPATPLFGL